MERKDHRGVMVPQVLQGVTVSKALLVQAALKVPRDLLVRTVLRAPRGSKDIKVLKAKLVRQVQLGDHRDQRDRKD